MTKRNLIIELNNAISMYRDSLESSPLFQLAKFYLNLSNASATSTICIEFDESYLLPHQLFVDKARWMHSYTKFELSPTTLALCQKVEYIQKCLDIFFVGISVDTKLSIGYKIGVLVTNIENTLNNIDKIYQEPISKFLGDFETFKSNVLYITCCL